MFSDGYRTIAVNQTVDCENSSDSAKKKKKKGEIREAVQDIVPEPFSLHEIKQIASKTGLDNFNVFNRLTVVFANQDSIYKVVSSNSYRLLTTTPNVRAQNKCCKTLLCKRKIQLRKNLHDF